PRVPLDAAGEPARQSMMWLLLGSALLCLIGGAGAALLRRAPAFLSPARVPRSPDVARPSPKYGSRSTGKRVPRSVPLEHVATSPFSARPSSKASRGALYSLRLGSDSGYDRATAKKTGKIALRAADSGSSDDNVNSNNSSSSSSSGSSSARGVLDEIEQKAAAAAAVAAAATAAEAATAEAEKRGTAVGGRQFGVAFVGLNKLPRPSAPPPRVEDKQQQQQQPQRRSTKQSRRVAEDTGPTSPEKMVSPPSRSLTVAGAGRQPVAATDPEERAAGSDARPWKWLRPPWRKQQVRRGAGGSTSGSVSPDASSSTRMVAGRDAGGGGEWQERQREPDRRGFSASPLSTLPPVLDAWETSAEQPAYQVDAVSTSPSTKQQQQQQAEEGNRILDAVMYVVTLGWPWAKESVGGDESGPSRSPPPQQQQQQLQQKQKEEQQRQPDMQEEANGFVNTVLGTIKPGVRFGWPWSSESSDAQTPLAVADSTYQDTRGVEKAPQASTPPPPPQTDTRSPSPRQDQASDSIARDRRAFSRARRAIGSPLTFIGNSFSRRGPTRNTAAGIGSAATPIAASGATPSGVGGGGGNSGKPPSLLQRSAAAPTIPLPPATASLGRRDGGGDAESQAPDAREPWRPPGSLWGVPFLPNIGGSVGAPDGRGSTKSQRGAAAAAEADAQDSLVGSESTGTGWTSPTLGAASVGAGEQDGVAAVGGGRDAQQQPREGMHVRGALSALAGALVSPLRLLRAGNSDIEAVVKQGRVREGEVEEGTGGERRGSNNDSDMGGDGTAVEFPLLVTAEAKAIAGGKASGSQGGGGVPWWQAGTAVFVGIGAALYRPVVRLPTLIFKGGEEDKAGNGQGQQQQQAEGQQPAMLLGAVKGAEGAALFPMTGTGTPPPVPAPPETPGVPPPAPQQAAHTGPRAPRKGVAGLAKKAVTTLRRARLWTLLKRRSRARAEPLLPSVETSIKSLDPRGLLPPPTGEGETSAASTLSSSSASGTAPQGYGSSSAAAAAGGEAR
ncbi:unnamed protein product, partial [Scytosiphon promiscuus]